MHVGISVDELCKEMKLDYDQQHNIVVECEIQTCVLTQGVMPSACHCISGVISTLISFAKGFRLAYSLLILSRERVVVLYSRAMNFPYHNLTMFHL